MNYKIKEYEERYFIGIEYAGGVQQNALPNLGQLWDDFLHEDIKLLHDVEHTEKFIGLECYPPDFKETKTFYYYALLETKQLVKQPGFSSKKLPKGKYMEFTISFDHIHDEIQKVYQFIRDNNLSVHYGFDYEDYILGEDYTKPGATLHFVLKVEE